MVYQKYKFIKVKWNGDDWGVMAFNEHFGRKLEAMVTPAPIVRFDTDYEKVLLQAKYGYADKVFKKYR